MATAARAASARKTRKARTAPTVQASTNLISSNSNQDSATALRAQVLSRYGIPTSLCAIVGALHYGEVRDAY